MDKVKLSSSRSGYLSFAASEIAADEIAAKGQIAASHFAASSLRRLVTRPTQCMNARKTRSSVAFSSVHGTGIAESNDVSTEFVFSQRGKRLLHYQQHLFQMNKRWKYGEMFKVLWQCARRRDCCRHIWASYGVNIRNTSPSS